MKEAIQIATSCAKMYDKELAGKNILFIYDVGEYVEIFSPKAVICTLLG